MLAVVDGDQGRPVNEDAVGTAAPQQQAAQETSSTLLALRIASAQNLDTLLADIVGANTDPSASANDANPVVDAVQNTTNSELPLGNGEPGGDAGETGSIIEEVIGYQNQTTKD